MNTEELTEEQKEEKKVIGDFADKYFDSVNAVDYFDSIDINAKQLNVTLLEQTNETLQYYRLAVVLYTIKFVKAYTDKYGYSDTASKVIFGYTKAEAIYDCFDRYARSNGFADVRQSIIDNITEETNGYRTILSLADKPNLELLNDLDRVDEIAKTIR